MWSPYQIHLQPYSSLFLAVLIVAAKATPPYTPTDLILLNCGSSSNQASLDGRNWDADVSSKFATSGTQNSSFTIASAPSLQNPSFPQIPYSTARLFFSPFTYTFPVASGPKFLRLYFYPETYSGHLKSDSFFSVIANGCTLLSNFSAFLTVSAIDPPVYAFMKEFVVDTGDPKQLNITFIPSSGSYAFVNGIEIVSMPNNLYLRGDNNNAGVTSLSATSLETVYRLNVGGKDVSPKEDTGMFRKWEQDQPYAITRGIIFQPQGVQIQYTAGTPAYTAPDIVYLTSRIMGGKDPRVNLNYNLSWYFQVDSGFYYLVRLHFCETETKVTKVNQRVFSVYINDQMAESDLDVIYLSGGNGVPVYQDYVVFVHDQTLWLALHPNPDSLPTYYDVILNGVEILKLNDSDGSLAGPNPELLLLSPQGTRPPGRGKSKSSKVIIIGAAFGTVFVVSLLIYLFLIWRRKRGVDSASSKNPSSLPSDLCRYFSIAEIKAATRDFNDQFVIGSGGFGKVYKGHINLNGVSTAVAIKRSISSSRQGVREFETEIKMLSQLRHHHLVALIGYCDDRGEMILVYEYMPRGTLRDHLYKTQNEPLTWKRRLQICIGAARGLQYLHTSAKHAIIHRDVKTTNILLDEKWAAKVSDFGLSRTGPTSELESHVSTAVRGSIGYVDPEYFRLQRLTEKSDVYSFGVVLFEVLCARPAVVIGLPKEETTLAAWGPKCRRTGTLHQIVDANLNGQIEAECLIRYGELAERCVANNGIDRPTMGDVVWALEFALQLQESAEKPTSGLGEEKSINNDRYDLDFGSSDSRSNSTLITVSTGEGETESDSSKLQSANVFSEIMDPTAR